MKDSARITKTAVFCCAFLLLCWMGMQILHEFGHVAGALATGGRVSVVVLDPLTISRSGFSSNPFPHVTVWAGPLAGTVVPLLVWQLLAGSTRRGRGAGGSGAKGQGDERRGAAEPAAAGEHSSNALTVPGLLTFFAGFCLVANGGYLLFGSFEGVGDCGVMQRCGTPQSVLVGVGGLMLGAGFWVWHRLGRLTTLVRQGVCSWRLLLGTSVTTLGLAGVCRLLFPDV